MAATPDNPSFFDKQVAGSLASAHIVLPLLFEYYKPRSIVDVGFAVGPWLKCSLELRVEEVLGIDGNYVDPSRLLTDRGQFRGSDLNDRIEVDRRFEAALSVDVGEDLSFFDRKRSLPISILRLLHEPRG